MAMDTTTITLVRHGAIDGVPALYGRTDIPMSENGRIQLRNTVTTIHHHLPVDRIISSPLIRCVEIASEFSLQENIPLQTNKEFAEMDFGSWDGVPFDELGSEWNNMEIFWNDPSAVPPPQGEHLSAFATRVINAWNNLLAQDLGQHTLVICHGGVIRIILAHILQIDWRSRTLFTQLHIDYATHTRIDIGSFEQAVPVIKYIGHR